MQQVKDKDVLASSSPSSSSSPTIPTASFPDKQDDMSAFISSSVSGSLPSATAAVVPSPHDDDDHDSGYGSSTSNNTDTSTSSSDGTTGNAGGLGDHAFDSLFLSLMNDTNSDAESSRISPAGAYEHGIIAGCEGVEANCQATSASSESGTSSLSSGVEEEGRGSRTGGGGFCVLAWLADTTGEKNQGGCFGEDSVAVSPAFSFLPMDFS